MSTFREAGYKVGDQVRVNAGPTRANGIRDSGCMMTGCIATVSSVHRDGKVSLADEDGDVHDPCGTWLPGDLQLVTKGEEVKPYQRKTYKQLKDSVTVKKGALWQEACDDGDQEYVLLDSAFNRDPRQTKRIYDRSLVEDDPKNFVEVFKVSPEYQTREELDLWEAFKKSQAKVRVTKPVAKRVARKTKKAA